MPGSKLLVTGGRGFLGRHLLALLHAYDGEVVVVSHNSDSAVDGFRCVRANLFDHEAVSRLLQSERPDTLLHLAWCTDHGNFWHSRDNLRWVSATLHLAEAFIASGGQRFIGAGSCAEYDWQQQNPLQETAQQQPSTLYGICKKACCDILQALFASADKRFFWGRIFFIYGPGEGENKLVSSAVRAFADGQPFSCRYPTLQRDYIHASDVALAFVKMLQAGEGGIYNIGSGQPTRLGEVVKIISRQFPAATFDFDPAMPVPADQPASIVADMEKSASLLGFTPRLSLEQGIQQQINQPLALANA